MRAVKNAARACSPPLPRAQPCGPGRRGVASASSPTGRDPMAALIEFVFVILHYLIQAVIWVIIANAIISWLIVFDVVNMRNRIVRQVVTFLDAITRPILKPVRRIIPTMGGIDISPLIVIVVLSAADQVLLPALYGWLV